jgi:mRNA interferase MazF
MIREGMVVLVPFPHAETDAAGKVRPAVVIRRLPGGYDDWLICMLSSQIAQAIEGFDDVITEDADDFAESGLKVSSVVRVTRLAVCHDSLMLGSIGHIADARLLRIRQRLSAWLLARSS